MGAVMEGAEFRERVLLPDGSINGPAFLEVWRGWVGWGRWAGGVAVLLGWGRGGIGRHFIGGGCRGYGSELRCRKVTACQAYGLRALVQACMYARASCRAHFPSQVPERSTLLRCGCSTTAACRQYPPWRLTAPHPGAHRRCGPSCTCWHGARLPTSSPSSKVRLWHLPLRACPLLS